MTSRTVKTLVAIVVGLVLVLFVLRQVDDPDAPEAGARLLPGLAEVANNIDRIRIVSEDNRDGVTLARAEGRWVVVERDNYAADLAKVRGLAMALAEAATVETKTANPEFYERLGLTDPGEDGEGTLVSVSGEGVDASVIFGDTAQGEYRYARSLDNPQTYLVDRSPELPSSAEGWLDGTIVDLAAADVARVVVDHGEEGTIELAKDDPAQANYTVANLPEGRALTYEGVGNGIAGALGDLTLEEVRKAGGGEAASTTTFTGRDGLVVTVKAYEYAPEEDADADLDEGAGETAEDELPEPDTWLTFEASATTDEARATADAINTRVTGWEYRIPQYKTELLTRTWDDLLETP